MLGMDDPVEDLQCEYTSESLKMLESKEGQLNAVFACFGSAAQHGQILEATLDELIRSLDSLAGQASPLAGLLDGASNAHRRAVRRKQTIGQLIGELKKRVTISDEWVWETLETALEQRNFLIHRYFLERADRFDSHSGRIRMLKELALIEGALNKATRITSGMRVAVDEAQYGERKETNDEPGLFSIRIEIPDPRRRHSGGRTNSRRLA